MIKLNIMIADIHDSCDNDSESKHRQCVKLRTAAARPLSVHLKPTQMEPWGNKS